MKKLFYIVLVIVALMVISRFVKENGKMEQTAAAPIETSEPVTATLPDTNCICDSEPACDAADTNCNSDETKTICKCTQANGETITIEQDVEDVVETDPAETSDEDETFVEESIVSETKATAEEPAAPATPAAQPVETTK